MRDPCPLPWPMSFVSVSIYPVAPFVRSVGWLSPLEQIPRKPLGLHELEVSGTVVAQQVIIELRSK